MKIEFVEYTGAYPVLCNGALALLVDGEEYIFNGTRENGQLRKPTWNEKYSLTTTILNKFWHSGGFVAIDDDLDEYIESGRWQVYKNELPIELQSYAERIEDILNDNVPRGCCCGCI